MIGLRGLREQREHDRAASWRQYRGWADPPDTDHVWLTTVQAPELLGISGVSVNVRCRRDQLPDVQKAGRRWLRRDLLEQVERAHEAQKERLDRSVD